MLFGRLWPIRFNLFATNDLMLRNYFITALRILRKQKLYGFINIVGLAAGMACCLLLLLYVQYERSYDRYHDHANRVARLVKANSANTPELWAPALEEEISEIEHAVRFMGGFSRALITVGDQHFAAAGGQYADAAVFEVLSWPFVQGDPETALVAPYSVVLSVPMAEQYFGVADPVGQVVTIGGISNDGGQRDYTVTGVMAPIPLNSHARFDYLISMKTVEVLDAAGEWGTPLSWTNRMVKTYVLLADGSNLAHVEAQLPAFLQRHIDDDRYEFTNVRLQLLTTIHLHSDLRSEFEPGGTITYVYLFSALALFILFIACVNFMNLATARAQQRAREVGVRKALGAHRMQLVRQFLGEAVVLSLMALLLALVLTLAMHPVFTTLIGKPLPLHLLGNGLLLAGLLGLVLVVGVLAGSYPAFVLARFKPARVLKGDVSQGAAGGRFRRGLVVFQFTVSIGLMASTVIVYTQLDYLQSKDLGFEEEQVIVLPIGHSEGLSAQADVLKATLAQNPHIIKVSASHSIPSQWLNGFDYLREGAALEEAISLSDVSVDHDFMETFGMVMVAGRSFSSELASDSNAFVLNETAVRELGWALPDEAVGRELEWLFSMGYRGPIIGVVKDFHFGSLHEAIPPIVFHISRFGSNFIAARIEPDDVGTTLAFLEQTWHRFEPTYPFEYFFVDEEFAGLYDAEARLARTFGYGALLALVIACLGLFGLAAFTVERSRKEIGVRKVLGASIASVVLRFLKEFLGLVLLAFGLAAPLAYLAMNRWLDTFAYRVTLGPGLFVAVGLAALLIAFLAVSIYALRAATTDPVNTLRHE